MTATVTLDRPTPPEPDSDLARLVRGVAAGEPQAWATVYDRYRGQLLAIGRSFRFSPDEVADAMQETWLRLFRHADQIRDPACLGGWLSQVMRNECRAAAVRRSRESLVPEWESLPDPDVGVDVEGMAVDGVLHAMLVQAVRRLPRHQRVLIHAVFLAPATSYEDIAATLSIPVGSIGPTRARALGRLRRLLAQDGLDAGLALAA